MPRARPSKSSHQSVSQHEDDIAEAIGGYAVGTRGPRQVDEARKIGQKRSDARSELYEVECKQTSKKSLSIKVEWLLDISRIAFGNGRSPLLSFRFLGVHRDMDQDWVMMPLREFKKMISNSKQ